MFATYEHQICTIFNSSSYNMVEKIKKRKGKMDKNLFRYMFATTKAKHSDEDKVCIQSGNVLTNL